MKEVFGAGRAERLTSEDAIARALGFESDDLDERLRTWLAERE